MHHGKGQELVYKHYTTEEGLAHDITYQIIQDKKGIVWIGTDDGLSKFNGSSFKNYTYENGLVSNYVIDIMETGNEEFIIGTWGGGLHYLKNDTIYKDGEEDLPSRIRNVYQLNDSLIFGARDGGYLLYNTRKKKKTEYSYQYKNTFRMFKRREGGDGLVSINEVFIDGEVYMHNSAIQYREGQLKGIYKFNGERIEKVDLPLTNNLVINGFTKKQSTMIVASGDKLFKYNNETLIDSFSINVENEKIIKVEIANNGCIYMVTLNAKDLTRKLYRYEPTTKVLTNISEKLHIKSFISDFMFDKDNSLWITTYGNGVYYLPNYSNLFLGDDYFINPDLKDIAKIDQELILLSPNYVYSVMNDSLTEVVNIPEHSERMKADDLQKSINLISVSNNELTIPACNYKINYGPTHQYNFKTKNGYLNFEYNYFSSDKNTILLHNRDSYAKKVVKYGNRIYALYDKLGVYVVDTDAEKLVEIWDKKNGFLSDRFNDISIVRDGIWLASDVGVIKITPEGKKWYTTKDGLLSNHINDLLIDSHGVLWIATQKGLNAFFGDHFYAIDRNLGQKSSFVTKIIETDGHIYVTGNKGLFKMDNYRPFKPHSSTELFVNQKNVLFELSTINYINPNSIKIQYQLNKGPWVETNNGVLNFENVKQGEYTIQFKFKDSLSKWRYTKEYHFMIKLPWYEQLWFYIISISVISIIVILLILRQLQDSIHKNKIIETTLKEREKLQMELRNVRQQIAQDFHDDLGNKLASVSILSNLSLEKIDEDNSLFKNLTQIKKDANFLFTGMRDFVWSLDYNHNKLVEVQLYLNDFGEQLFENTSIHFKSTNNVSSSNLVLPHYWNKQLVLTFKEAMTNVLKHSKASQLLFDVQLNEKILEIKLIDNGVGIDFEKVDRINGLNNMKKRIATIGGELWIENTDNGFMVYFRGNIDQEK